MDPRDVWLKPQLQLLRNQDPKIGKLLSQTAADVAKIANRVSGQNVSAEVKRAQLTGTNGALKRRLAEFWRGLENLTRAGQLEARAAAIDAQLDWDDVLLAMAYPDEQSRVVMRSALMAAAERGIDAMLLRALGRSYVPLSRRVHKTQALAEGWLDRKINAALARGASPFELAKDVRQFIRPDTPGGVSYASKRLARTEINNAFHAQVIDSNSDKPWVTGMEWKLSGSHPRPDVCDRLARGGPYAKTEVPAKPHPNCLCYLVPAVMSEAEFEDRLVAGEFDGYLTMNYGQARRTA